MVGHASITYSSDLGSKGDFFQMVIAGATWIVEDFSSIMDNV